MIGFLALLVFAGIVVVGLIVVNTVMERGNDGSP